MIFAADYALLNLFFLGVAIWGHSIDFCMDSGSKQWTHVSSLMTVCDRKLSDQVSHWHERSVAVACLVSLGASGTINGTQLAKKLE